MKRRVMDSAAWRKFRSLTAWQQLLIALAAVLLLQQLVPAGAVSIFAKLDGRPLAFSTITSVQARYAENAQKVEFRFDDKNVRVATEDLGIEADAQTTLARIPRVTKTNKLIPFSVIYKLFQPKSIHSTINRDGKKQLATIGRLINQHSYNAVNATGVLNAQGELRVAREKPGKRYDLTELSDEVAHVRLYGDKPIVVRGKKYDAAIKTSDFAAAKKQIETVKKQTLHISVQDRVFSVQPKTYLSSLEVTGTSAKDIHLQFSKTGLAALLTRWGQNYDTIPGTTVINYRDGKEIDRKVGKSGRAIDKTKAALRLRTWLAKPSDEEVALETTTLPAKVQKNRSYSNTSAGLAAHLGDWASDHGGGYNIAAVEIGGAGRSAAVSGGRPTVLASTYKLFVAYAAYVQAEKGRFDLSKKVLAEKTAEDCIGRAIVYSDNDCAKAVALALGWEKCQELVQNAGLTSIKLNNYDQRGNLDGEKMGTASDIATFLRRLSRGSMLNNAHTTRLLDYMKRQIYRRGIPAGSASVTVADKVGFLDGYTHDAGIVYASGRSYVLVVMSNRGNNWANIQDVSSMAYKFFSN